MTDQKSGPEDRKDMTVETMALLAELAEKGGLSGLLRTTADYFAEKAENERRERGQRGPKRRPAYGVRLPLRNKWRKLLSRTDQAALFWGYGLVIALHQAMDGGGRRARVYLTAGRKAPSDAVVLLAADLLRQSGLTVRLRDRRPDARVITICC